MESSGKRINQPWVAALALWMAVGLAACGTERPATSELRVEVDVIVRTDDVFFVPRLWVQGEGEEEPYELAPDESWVAWVDGEATVFDAEAIAARASGQLHVQADPNGAELRLELVRTADVDASVSVTEVPEPFDVGSDLTHLSRSEETLFEYAPTPAGQSTRIRLGPNQLCGEVTEIPASQIDGPAGTARILPRDVAIDDGAHTEFGRCQVSLAVNRGLAGQVDPEFAPESRAVGYRISYLRVLAVP